MSLADAFAPVIAHNRRIVEHETWGHLAPEPQVIYPGYIVFTHGAYGDIVVIESDFGELPDSPWFYRAQADYIGDYIVTPKKNECKMRGGVWKFEGHCKMFKNGRIKFTGKIRPMRIIHRFNSK